MTKRLLIVLALSVSSCSTCPALTDREAILTIIGEAESEPMQGKIAVGEVIRRRGNLKGCYGLTAPRVTGKLYSQKTFDDASLAWRMSKTSNLTGKADGWGNASDIRKFKTQKWFKKCRVVKQIGNHYFWKQVIK